MVINFAVHVIVGMPNLNSAADLEKKVASFFEVKGPHIFFWTRAPLRVNPAHAWIANIEGWPVLSWLVHVQLVL